jgi:hypothetical protein
MAIVVVAVAATGVFVVVTGRKTSMEHHPT